MKHTLFLFLLLPSFLTALEIDYRPTLRAAILAEDEGEVKEILDSLPLGIIPEVTPAAEVGNDPEHFVNAWTRNPIFLDTTPTILEMLYREGVSVKTFIQEGTYNHYPVEEHTRYENVAWLLAKDSPYSTWHSLKHALENKKDPRIICALLLSGAQPIFHHEGMRGRRDHPIHSDCFFELKKLKKEEREIDFEKRKKLYWIALAIGHEKAKHWKKQLYTMIDIYPKMLDSQPSTFELLRKRRRGVHFTKDQHLAAVQKSFESPYEKAYKEWLQSKDLSKALEKMP